MKPLFCLALVLTGCLTDAGREIGLVKPKPKVCTEVHIQIGQDTALPPVVDTVACDSTH